MLVFRFPPRQRDRAMLKNRGDGTNASQGFASTPSKTILEILLAFWIMVVNLVYYVQFKSLILSRFGHFLHRWH
jgi:hypothetical protein